MNIAITMPKSRSAMLIRNGYNCGAILHRLLQEISKTSSETKLINFLFPIKENPETQSKIYGKIYSKTQINYLFYAIVSFPHVVCENFSVLI